jgi:hypothetical protein
MHRISMAVNVDKTLVDTVTCSVWNDYQHARVESRKLLNYNVIILSVIKLIVTHLLMLSQHRNVKKIRKAYPK